MNFIDPIDQVLQFHLRETLIDPNTEHYPSLPGVILMVRRDAVSLVSMHPQL